VSSYLTFYCGQFKLASDPLVPSLLALIVNFIWLALAMGFLVHVTKKDRDSALRAKENSKKLSLDHVQQSNTSANDTEKNDLNESTQDNMNLEIVNLAGKKD